MCLLNLTKIYRHLIIHEDKLMTISSALFFGLAALSRRFIFFLLLPIFISR